MEHTNPPNPQPTASLTGPLAPAGRGEANLTADRSYDLAGRTPELHEARLTGAAIGWRTWRPPVSSLGVAS